MLGVERHKTCARPHWDALDCPVTSDVVADPGSEAAPPGDDVPVEDLPVDTARLH